MSVTREQIERELMRRAIEAELASRKAETPEYYGEPVVKDGQYQVGGEVSRIKEGLGGIVEPALTMGTGMVAETVGNIGGGNPDNPMAGPESAERIKKTMTYQPRTLMGRQILQGQAEALQPVADVVESARLGDEALEAGAPEWVAKNAEAIPEYISAVISGMGLLPKAKSAAQTVTRTKQTPIGALDEYGNIKPVMDKKAILRDQLRRKTGQGSTAKYELEGAELVKSGTGKAALSQGWDDITVAGTKVATPATKSKIKQMVDLAKRRLTESATAESKISLRPSDIAGKSLMERYTFIDKANKSAGSLMDKIARDHKGIVNISPAMNWLKNELQRNGIELLPNGRIDFSKSKVLSADYGLIRENIKQLQLRLKDPMTFHNAHTLKQTMRRSGLSYGETAMKKGATPEVQAIFKGFSRKIDDILDTTSDAYNKQNIKWAETNDALDAVKKIAKDNLFQETPESNLGVLTKRMMGNPTSRQAVINYTKKLDEISAKYGGKFDDDLFLQAYVANDMDKVIEVAAQASLKGEAGAQAFAQQIDKSAMGKAAHAIDTAARFIGRKSEIKALNTLQALTK
jgi:hypothetical protein